MATSTEAFSWQARLLQDLGRLAGLAVILVPLYLLCNDYWRSIERLIGLYFLLILFCMRLGGGLQRRIKRFPADIPPWRAGGHSAPAELAQDMPFTTAEVVQNIRHDPRYVQDVLKPRLRNLLAYRSGIEERQGDEAWALRLMDPVVLAFLQRRETIGMWATYGQRQQRLQEVVEILRRIDGMPG